MMIDINTYAYTPATVFDLHGACPSTNQRAGVPCRIKVGPRRWLKKRVIPENLSVTIWQERHGQTTYLQHEPVQTSVDKNGILTVDMAAFAQETFGKDHVHFCDSNHWNWHKNYGWSDTFLTTDYGIAAHSSAWLDISVHHSNLYLMPGTLNLCGHDVRHISWETFCDELAAPGESMRSLVTELLSGPHTASAEDVIKRLKQVKYLEDWGFNRLTIRTDRGRFSMSVGLNRSLSVELKEGSPMMSVYEPSQTNNICENLNLLLQMLQAADGEEIRSNAEALHRNGLLVKRK